MSQKGSYAGKVMSKTKVENGNFNAIGELIQAVYVTSTSIALGVVFRSEDTQVSSWSIQVLWY